MKHIMRNTAPKPSRHAWTVSPAQAVAIQQDLARLVSRQPPRLERLRRIAGLDAAFTRDGLYCIGGALLWDVEQRAVVEQRFAKKRLRFPYIPGLLSFREAPALLAAVRKLRMRPDVLICDGQGIAHPRRFGIASHVGVLTGLPTIGCAKSILVGTHEPFQLLRGESRPLRDRKEVVGLALCTRDGVKPVFISIGHRMDLPTAARIVLMCCTGYRLPEPTRQADRLVGQIALAAARSARQRGEPTARG